ncbi:hypothetical protein SK128_018680, partial [Halocaridina rubra]
IWSNMTIELTLMQSMKSAGGLTHSRGMTDSMLEKWILGVPTTLIITEKIEDIVVLLTVQESSMQMPENFACQEITKIFSTL